MIELATSAADTRKHAPVTALLLGLVVCGPALADTVTPAEIIRSDDPRFAVFELSNAAGDGMPASPRGTVLFSFRADDGRYCRAARFPTGEAVLLACRGEHGWRVEATSSLAPGDAINATVAYGGNMQGVNEAVQRLNPDASLLDQLEIIDAAASGWRGPVVVDEQALDARTILNRTRRAYRTARSYVDSGHVQTIYTSPAHEHTGETRFSTAYAAPHDFRFESRMGDFGNIEVHFIAWRDEDSVKSWMSTSPQLVENLDSIERVLDAGAGISRDTSGMIPGLIIPGTKLGGDIVRLKDPVRLDDETIDGVDCYLVRGTRFPHKGPTSVWIDKQDYLVRRVYEESDVGGTVTRTTWFYQPEINLTVTPDRFEFGKPASP